MVYAKPFINHPLSSSTTVPVRFACVQTASQTQETSIFINATFAARHVLSFEPSRMLTRSRKSISPNVKAPPHPQSPFVAPPLPPPSLHEHSADDVMYNFLTASMELRQRARSALLDAYRRFVVHDLKSRLPLGGYAVWIAQSTLRRTKEQMASLAESAASIVSIPLPDISF